MESSTTQIDYNGKTQQGVFFKDTVNRKTLIKGYFELTKPRLSLLSVITALVGYIVALPQQDMVVLLSLIFGTSLAAGGCGVLNQWWEKDTDSVMVRTKNRPIPSGEVNPTEALLFGIVLCVIGDIILWYFINPLAATLALATEVLYILAYTPLKKYSHWSLELGAIPGALPPLIGWAAAESNISFLGWVLFFILFCWQIPHFLALAWKYREDYKIGGFPMLTVIDLTGVRAGRQSLIFTILLFVSSLIPYLKNYTTGFYAVIALLTGIWILVQAIQFSIKSKRDNAAGKLFFTSIAYLPILLGALVIDRWLLM